MKSVVVHYKNKYPNGRIDSSEDKLDVYCSDGVHRVALRRGGDGQMKDLSAEMGAVDCHDLSPIPKNSRAHKLHADGKIGLDELAESRFSVADKIKVQNKVLSIAEYKKSTAHVVDESGNVKAFAAQPAQDN